MANQLARIVPGRKVAVADDTTNRALLEFQSPTLALISRPVPPLSSRLTMLIGSMVFIMVVIMATLPIDRVVTGSGRVAPQSATLLVQPLETSIIRSIDVKIGQHVRKGDVLAHLDPTFKTADLAASRRSVESLRAEVDRLRAEMTGQVYVSDGSPSSQLQAGLFVQRKAERELKLETYRQKISSLQTALNKANDEVRSYGERFGLATSLLQSREEAERLGVGSKLNTLSARDSKAESLRTYQTSQSAALAARKDLDAMIAERDSTIQTAKVETSQARNDAERKLSDAMEQLNKALRLEELITLKAEQDATVLTISTASAGSVLGQTEPLMTLVPDDATIEIEGAIPAGDIAFVRVGDEVNIKFEAYRSNEHGYAVGHVRVISPDAQTNPGQTSIDKPQLQQAPVDLGTSVYRVKVSIDELKLTNIPADFRLLPGLSATIDIQVGKRTILSYFFTRMIPTLAEAMREP
jgi:HlyD family secretion protein